MKEREWNPDKRHKMKTTCCTEKLSRGQCHSLAATIAVTWFDIVSTLLCCDKSPAILFLKGAGCYLIGLVCFVLPFGVLFLFRGDKGKAVSFRWCGVRSCVWAAPLWKGGKVPVSSVALRDLVSFPCCCLGGLTIPWCSLGFLAGVEQEECEPPWASRCAKKGKVLELISPHIAIKRITSLTVSGTIYRQIPFLVCWGLMFMPAGFSVGGFLCGN